LLRPEKENVSTIKLARIAPMRRITTRTIAGSVPQLAGSTRCIVDSHAYSTVKRPGRSV
jgi:hypothetical protein